ncbi:MAG TPA: ABC transporter substrate-binding protein [Ktedonosporobacter sp.]|nr:ABC transporter substrate-binding protein [Ktedonosporobacter sp.]
MKVASAPLTTSTGRHLARGDVLHGRRYRLLEPISLPESQQGQGTAWLAIDAQSARYRVCIRQIDFPEGSAVGDPQRIVEGIVQRLMELAKRHPGFPSIIDRFVEQDIYYIVWQYPEGESLATLLTRQGGALPEREVAEYGRQLCEMLGLLAQQSPPLVHGGISPETIIVSPDRRWVSLIHIPLFTPRAGHSSNTPAAHISPEQIRGAIHPSADLYSLASTLHHAVTGYDPKERLAFFYPPARRLNPLVSANMEAILARGVRLTALQRYIHPSEMEQELTNLLASLPAVIDTPRLFFEPQLPSVVQLRQQSRRRGIRNLVIPGIISGVTILAFLMLYFMPIVSRGAFTANSVSATTTASAQQLAAQQAALTSELKLEMQSYQQKGIGVSDGNLAFDMYPGRKDSDLKKQAAQAWQKGDMSSAVNLLNQAVSLDPIDGEAQIYNENIHIQQNATPFITLALGMPIDGSVAHMGSDREQLEAVYLAQHAVNSKSLLPHGLKLRIIIANSGAKNADVAAVAQFIADRVAKVGNLDHLIGVIGWYNSSQTINARDIIASAHLPLLAPTASTVKLSGSSPYFFRVAPPDNLQGQVLGTLVVNQLKAKKILILSDPTDSYSISLANAAAKRIEALGGSFTTGVFTEGTTTVEQYQQMVENSVFSNTPIDAILLAGIDIDGIRLAHAVGNVARANPADIQLSHLRVVGGDAVDSRLLLGEGSNADAAIAQSYPKDMARLIFTTFADFNEWTFLKVAPDKQPTFFSDWKATYQSSMVSANAPDPAYKGLMIYDAVDVYMDAATLIQGPINGDSVRNALITLGKGNVPAYQGISGRITFDTNGDPIDKAVVVLDIEDDGNGNVIKILQLAGTFQ